MMNKTQYISLSLIYININITHFLYIVTILKNIIS
uniref:Uncharacterized protein n=1 Tax=Vertebrata thuyoides TaxID=2006970 RepID=A0A1Z1MAH4_9FLOR|nr:hypothetical protein [Vertebrata thuyoides]ARW63087.1 hypothetical protein [Vertebrata thuyoides]